MRNQIFSKSWFAIVLLSMTVLVTACKFCEPNDCVHGECRGGRCHCDEGWKGGECTERILDPLTGVYSVDDFCVGDHFIVIESSTNPSYDLQIKGLHGVPTDVVFANKDKWLEGGFDIPKQSCSPSGFMIDGNAIKNGNGTTTINYTTYDLDDIPDDICIARITKQ